MSEYGVRHQPEIKERWHIDPTSKRRLGQKCKITIVAVIFSSPVPYSLNIEVTFFLLCPFCLRVIEDEFN